MAKFLLAPHPSACNTICLNSSISFLVIDVGHTISVCILIRSLFDTTILSGSINSLKQINADNFELIDLSNRGEIFLNPELNKIIKYACEKEIKLTAITGVNLNTVSEQTLENLVKYKFNKMTISIDGATPETYKIYRVGGDFNTVINNIKTINKFKKLYGSEFPRLNWQFIVFGHNEHEIELAKIKAKELNIPIMSEEEFLKKIGVE